MLWDALRDRFESTGARMAVGMMVGTSLDGIDLCLVELADSSAARAPSFRAGATASLQTTSTETLRRLAEDSPAPASAFAGCAWALREDHERALRAFLREQSVALEQVVYVATHGVTVSHRPNATEAHSWQILDAEGLAARLGCPVFSNFRAAEVALGGQGAPLAPVVDSLLRSSEEFDRAILNLGGIANVTLLPAGGGACIAADLGPANMPLDLLWRRAGAAGPHDRGGELARGGRVDEALLGGLLEQPWVEQPLPRSFGREEFGEAWVQALEASSPGLSLADRLATVAALEAQVLSRFLRRVVPADWRAAPGHALELFVTGGGVHNEALLNALRALQGVELRSIAALGEDPDFKEAYDFAVLGWLRLRHEIAAGQRERGAARECVLGSIHFPDGPIA